MSRYCMDCGGVAHPATGCEYSPTALLCGPCVRKLWLEWVIPWTAKRAGGRGRPNARNPKARVDRPVVYFYECAGK